MYLSEAEKLERETLKNKVIITWKHELSILNAKMLTQRTKRFLIEEAWPLSNFMTFLLNLLINVGNKNKTSSP